MMVMVMVMVIVFLRVVPYFGEPVGRGQNTNNG